jgi:DNA-binding transcriptional LysR family regulator
VEKNGLAQAAESLFVSQSTISYRLNELEEEIGAKLIYRKQGKRTITLTPKGEDFISLAARWIALEKETNQWKNKKITELNLNIGTVDSLNTYLFHPLYKKIMQDSTHLNLNITAQLSITAYDLLKSYEIDIGLILRYINLNNIITKPIFSERMVLVSDNIISGSNDFIKPSDLDPTKEIYVDLGLNLDTWRDSWFGQPLKSKFLVIDNAGLLLKLIKNSDYWAIIPITVANDITKRMNINIYELSDAPSRICYIAKHKSPKLNTIKPIKLFEEYLNDYIANNPNLDSLL